MLIEPASKVSVPLTVVMRTRSRVLASVLTPDIDMLETSGASNNPPTQVQALDPKRVKTTEPEKVLAAAFEYIRIKPVVAVAPRVVLLVVVTTVEIAEYPVVSAPEEVPSCICGSEVPLVETPLNITVIRFTQDGMLVKSMLVPLVLATAVPEVIPSTAPELIVTLAEPSIIVLIV